MADTPELRQQQTRKFREAVIRETMARARVMVTTDEPFAERMVLFWSNHFTVSRTKGIVGPIAPAYEREVIRPNIFGRFSDLLVAVCRHPAMLSYLDNHLSIGENSRAGKRRRRRTGTEKTLNENLAREILELHTLGVDGGYSQTDVIELAKAISGWSHGGTRLKFEKKPTHGHFEFKSIFHEPGKKTVLGKTYADDGAEQGLAILRDLADHPSTARFIATKLVRHFVSDDPPLADVDHIAEVFERTSGDLAKVSSALIDLESAWSKPLAKVKNHYEYVISVNRAMGNQRPRQRDVLYPLHEMGQLPFSAQSPAGWGDRANDWIAPEALMRRVEWTHRVTRRLPATLVPEDELDRLLGASAGTALHKEVQRASSGHEAMALILASSEFQRR